MEVGGGPIAGFGGAPAERLPRYGVAFPRGRSLLVFYGHVLRHFRFDYCDPGEPLLCCGDLRRGSLLGNCFDPPLVASEDSRVGTVVDSAEMLPSIVKGRDYPHFQPPLLTHLDKFFWNCGRIRGTFVGLETSTLCGGPLRRGACLSASSRLCPGGNTGRFSRLSA